MWGIIPCSCSMFLCTSCDHATNYSMAHEICTCVCRVLFFHDFNTLRPGPWFNIKTSSYQYRKFRCEDKTVVRSSYLHNGISYSGKISSLYWIRALDKTDDISETTFSNALPWMKMLDSSNNFTEVCFPGYKWQYIPILVQIMAWHHTGNKPLSEPMLVSLLPHICIIQPQWVNWVCVIHICRSFMVTLMKTSQSHHYPRCGKPEVNGWNRSSPTPIIHSMLGLCADIIGCTGYHSCCKIWYVECLAKGLILYYP